MEFAQYIEKYKKYLSIKNSQYSRFAVMMASMMLWRLDLIVTGLAMVSIVTARERSSRHIEPTGSVSNTSLI